MTHPSHVMFDLAIIVTFPSFSHRIIVCVTPQNTLEEVTSTAAVSQLSEFSATKQTLTGSDCHEVQNKLI